MQKCPYGILLKHHCPLPAWLDAGGSGAAEEGEAQPPQAQAQGPTESYLDALFDDLHAMDEEQQAAHPGQGGGQVSVTQQGTAAAAVSAAQTGPTGGARGASTAPQAAAASHPRPASAQPGAGPQASARGSLAVGPAATQPAGPGAASEVWLAPIPPTQPVLVGDDDGVPATQPDGAAGPAAGPGGPTPAALAAALASSFTPAPRVAAFVWGALRRIVPRAFLGDRHNQRVLRRAIARFVGLRRWERMSAHQALQGMRVEGLPWLQPPPGAARGHRPPSWHAAQQRRLALWLAWLFGDLISSLLRAHFYATESEATRQVVFFYRKPVWARLAKQAVAELVGTQFQRMPLHAARETLERRKLGVAKYRLLPKRTGESGRGEGPAEGR